MIIIIMIIIMKKIKIIIKTTCISTENINYARPVTKAKTIKFKIQKKAQGDEDYFGVFDILKTVSVTYIQELPVISVLDEILNTTENTERQPLAKCWSIAMTTSDKRLKCYGNQ